MRNPIIITALLATLLACFFAPDNDTPAPPQARARPAFISAPAPVALDIHPRGGEEELGNLFARQSWQPQAPDPMQAPADSHTTKPKAQQAGAPALAIRYLGRFADDGKQLFFLQVGERNVVARIGDTIDDYRFDSVTGDSLNFTYLPLQLKQVLAAGEPN
ncbi:MAG: hypothetical protein V4508_17670 [Pseudomonadota bacterium]